MRSLYPIKTLRDAGVHLLDCEHKTPRPSSGGYPYIAIPNIRDGRIDLSEVRLISRHDLESWTRKTRPMAGDVIVTRRGRVGDTAVVPEALECAIGQNLVILRSDGRQIRQDYLRWCLRGPGYEGQVRTYLNVGAVFDSLNCADIPKFAIPVPPIHVQEEIASILGALDDKIELNRRMNETLEEVARAIFRAWFEAARPTNGGAAEVQCATLADLVTLARVSVNPGDFPDEVFDYFSIPAYDTGKMPVAERGAAIRSNKYRVPADSILVSKLNPQFPRTWLPRVAGKRAIASTEYLVLQPQQGISREFVYCLCSSDDFTTQVAERVTGTSGSHQRARPEDVLSIQFPRPAAAAVARFTQQVEALFRLVESHKTESQTLATIRDTLLPKLLSGEVRVREAEKLVEASA